MSEETDTKAAEAPPSKAAPELANVLQRREILKELKAMSEKFSGLQRVLTELGGDLELSETDSIGRGGQSDPSHTQSSQEVMPRSESPIPRPPEERERPARPRPVVPAVEVPARAPPQPGQPPRAPEVGAGLTDEQLRQHAAAVQARGHGKLPIRLAEYKTSADAYKLLLGMDMLYTSMGASDTELLGRAYSVTSSNTALWQAVAIQGANTYPVWRALFYQMTRPDDTTTLYQDALSLKQGKTQDVLDYIAKKVEAFTRAGIQDTRVVIQLIIDGMLLHLAMDIRRTPPSLQPRTVPDLQELAKSAESNWKIYRKAKPGKETHHAEVAKAIWEPESDSDGGSGKVACPARKTESKTDMQHILKALEGLTSLNLGKMDPTKCMGTCWQCGEVGHFRRDCPKWKEYLRSHPEEADEERERQRQRAAGIAKRRGKEPAAKKVKSESATTSGKGSAPSTTHSSGGAPEVDMEEEEEA
jgi:hypothetical protein